MIKYRLGIFLILLLNVSLSQENIFPGLRHLVVDSTLNVSINYNPKLCKVLMQQFNNEAEVYFVNILLSRLVPTIPDTFMVQYNGGASDDPVFSIYRKNGDELIELGTHNGLELSIPGTGFLYISGHINNMFNVRRKFAVTKDTLREILQPFYFVGLQSKTTKEIIIYSDTSLSKSVALISNNSAVTVVVNTGEYYLIKTSFGLLGWVKINEGTSAWETPIKDLYYAGD